MNTEPMSQTERGHEQKPDPPSIRDGPGSTLGYRLFRSGALGLGCAVLAGLPIVVTARGGSTGAVPLVLVEMGLLCSLPVALLFLPFRTSRVGSLRFLVFAVSFIAGATGAHALSHRIRQSSFAQVAERVDPIISAIQAYNEEHGQPPEDLKLLVPTYLERVPSTGSSAYAHIEYKVLGASDLYWYDLGSRAGRPIVGRGVTGDGPRSHAILYFKTDCRGSVLEVAGDRLPAEYEDNRFDAERWGKTEDRMSMVRDVVRSLDPVGQPFQRVTQMLGQPEGQRQIGHRVPWELRVANSGGFMSFEYYFYWPTEVYPDFVDRRMGRWALIPD